MLKKTILLMSVVFFLAPAVCALASDRPEYRVGIKGGVFYPPTSNPLVKTDAMSLLLELDVKRSSQLDTGFRIGYDAVATRATDFYACYNLFQLGYGARYYFDARKSPEPEFHTFKRYVMADGFLALCNKTKDLDSTITSPQNLYGIGLKIGAGLEYVFGPLSSGFVDVEYLISNTQTSNGSSQFPMNGLAVAFGVRLAR